jgi:plastocyanin
MKYFLLPLILLISFTTSAQTTHEVLVANMSYTPSELSIEVGDQVTFILEGGTHDVNFDINSQTGQSFGNPDEITSLSMQSESGEMGSITFNVPGTYNYDCSVYGHASMGMVGSIIVEETAAQSLSVDVADYYYSAFGEQCTAYVDVTNTSSQDLMFHVTRSSSTDLTNYFCWGPTCYPPNSNESYTSTNSLLINAGETLTGLDSFIGYVNDLPENSSLDIDYCFWVDGNPSDEKCVVVTYTNKDSFMTIEDLSFSHEIYPNPVQDILHINLLSSNPVEFVLFDMLGSQVYNEVFTSSSNINVSSFEAGIYFYKFNVKGKETEVQKLIITH